MKTDTNCVSLLGVTDEQKQRSRPICNAWY